MSSTFHAHEVALEMAVALRPCLEALARHDRDLASQLRRAAASVRISGCCLIRPAPAVLNTPIKKIWPWL